MRGRCLVSHIPNPQFCALSGGVWDDSVMSLPESFAGACVSPRAVAERMAAAPGSYELKQVREAGRGGVSWRAQVVGCFRADNGKWWWGSYGLEQAREVGHMPDGAHGARGR